MNAIVALGLLMQSGPKKDWVWWTPPGRIGKADRLGYSCDAIVKMGLDRWCDFAGSRIHLDTVEGAPVVFGVCQRQANDRAFAHLPVTERADFRRLRTDLYRFSMACVAFEDFQGMGSTAAIHEPMFIFADLEQGLAQMVGRRHLATNESLLPRLDQHLVRLGKSKAAMSSRQADADYFAGISRKYLAASVETAKRLDIDRHPALARFLSRYAVDYFK